MSCRFLDLLSHFLIAVEVENVSHKIQCVLIILDFGVEIGEVKSICKVFFVDVTEILIAT